MADRSAGIDDALRVMMNCDETEGRPYLRGDSVVAMHFTVAALALDLIVRRYRLEGARLKPDIVSGLAMLERNLRRLRGDGDAAYSPG